MKKVITLMFRQSLVVPKVFGCYAKLMRREMEVCVTLAVFLRGMHDVSTAITQIILFFSLL